jgi:hypothetical protein
LTISSKGSFDPKRDNERRVGISSARCVTSVGAKESISELRCFPEKFSGAVLAAVRYFEKAFKPGRKESKNKSVGIQCFILFAPTMLLHIDIHNANLPRLGFDFWKKYLFFHIMVRF